MESNKIIHFIEYSFLRELLLDEEVTDISFNGYSVFYMHNSLGRQASKIRISNIDAKDFIRQLANLTEKQFSFQNPILDVTAGRYRINAVHNSIGRYGEEQVVTFAIRIASISPKITDDSGFLPKPLISLIKTLLSKGVPIVIGGITGTGKTEFQKYLLGKMDPATRVIVIDNVLELSSNMLIEDTDMNIWQSDDKANNTSVQTLVRNALRSNPDWLIIAESRGGEMLDILNSVMTGHPVITTIHARSVKLMPNRIARMVMMNDKRSDYDEVLQDIFLHFPIYFFLKRKVDKKGKVIRFIDSIMVVDEIGNQFEIYKNLNGKHVYQPLPKSVLSLIDEADDELFVSTFGGKGK